MTRKIKAVIYTRVSTDEQAEHGFSLRDQKNRLIRYCTSKDYEVIQHYQEDHSAKNFNRPEFQRFLQSLKRKEIHPNLFVCVRPDRFSRNTMESMQMVSELGKYGVGIDFIEGDIFDPKVPESFLPYIINLALP